MQTFNNPILEQALASLGRLSKAANYYPDAHPSVMQAARTCTEKFNLGLKGSQDGVISVEIRRQGFMQGEAWLNPDNKMLPQLAQRFFSHRIKSMVIFPSLSEQHLLSLVHCLVQEPDQLDAKGGAAHVLEQQQASSILLNEMNLGAISSRKRTLEAHAALQHTSDSADIPAEKHTNGNSAQNHVPLDIIPDQTLTETLRAAQQLMDLGQPGQLSEFQVCLEKIKRLLNLALTEAQQHSSAMLALTHFERWIYTGRDEYSSVCRMCLQDLDQNKVVALLLENARNNRTQQDIARRLIKLLDSGVSHNVWQHLVRESDPRVRRFLAVLMEELGPAADRVMLEYLDDSRWYVVRNALKILSSRRNPEYTQAFSSQLLHADDRVVQEALSALAGIRDETAVDALLSYLNSPVCTLPDLAIFALGAQKSSRAVKTLCNLGVRRDTLLKNKKTTLKVIEALGDIRDPAANNTLIAIIKKDKLIKRKEYRELRLAAINALGKTATQEEQNFLQCLASSRDKAVASCAIQAAQVGKKG
ncbi:MAG: HEAT repeat domain-containing protein [Desulfuromonadaceae bacterium]|nr:HEAT repeat domain-containing protein [Desulfuromonadaceae bacterium]